ncbi:P-loop containing nucleoside triphosphate hydrolase protein [Rhizophagus irregularis]|uniref:P-loop containing nucleoside triphosphate hydrolase protein n=1 Tax=Rhizophagus irregularis TaxID=588596 RepID=A0A2N0RGP8_9GLOM|nr:P-loop containing nucleoside triphosphate hydrolase protein [Rhizophagus irregularis]
MSGRSTGGGNNSKNTRPRSNRGRRGGGSNGDGRRDQRRDIIDEGRNYIPAPPKLSVPEIKQSQQETAIANFSSSELTYNGSDRLVFITNGEPIKTIWKRILRKDKPWNQSDVRIFVSSALVATDYQIGYEIEEIVTELGNPESGLKRLREIINFPSISCDAGLDNDVLSFQHVILPLLGLFTRTAITECILEKYVHAIFSTVYVNLDSFLYDKVIKMLETLVNRNSVKDNRVSVETLLLRERYSFIPSSLGVFFLIIVRLLTELLRRVKEASVNETMYQIANDLYRLKTAYQQSLEEQQFSPTDPLISNLETRKYFFTILDREMKTMDKMLNNSRKGLIFEQNLGAKNLNVESDKSYYKELARRVDAERTYDPPGELSKYGRRHDNDFIDISEISIIPTKEEILCDRLPFLPSTLRNSLHFLPDGAARLLDTQFRLLREDLLNPIRGGLSHYLTALLQEHTSSNSDVKLSKEFKKIQEEGGRFSYNNGVSENGDLQVYTNIHFTNISCDRRKGFACTISFTPPRISTKSEKGRREYWEKSRRLLTGSLVTLILPNPNPKKVNSDDSTNSNASTSISNIDLYSLYFGVVVSRDEKALSSKENSAEIDIDFIDPSIYPIALSEFSEYSKTKKRPLEKRFMVESTGVYLEAYYHVLKTLQTTDLSLRFEKYLAPNFDDMNDEEDKKGKMMEEVNSTLDIKVENPPYTSAPGFQFDLSILCKNKCKLKLEVADESTHDRVIKNIVKYSNIGKLPNGTPYGLDETQAKALISSLTREIALIEGPPGTGKTVVGVQIMKVLLAKENRKTKIGPILTICFTNHALDQFLEHLVDENITKIVRLGSRTKSEKIKEFNLEEICRKRPRSKSSKKELAILYSSIEKIEKYVQKMRGALFNRWMKWSDISEYLMFEEATFYSKFSYVSEDELPSWVLGTDDDEEFETVGKNNKQKRKDPFDEWIEGEDIRIINKRKRLLLNPPKSDKKNKKRPNKNIFDILREETGDSMDISDDGSQVDYIYWIKNYQEPKTDRLLDELLIDHSIWRMSKKERKRLHDHWRTKIYKEIVEKFSELQKRHEKIRQEINRIYDEGRRQVLKSSDVIGMTTNGAAKFQILIRSIGPKIIICEEAGEVLEAHILSALTPSTQHLILIGDHNQLRPHIATYSLSVDSPVGNNYQLDKSLFERLVNGDKAVKIEKAQLLNQRRMRGEISDLIRYTIYPELIDGDNTTKYENVRGAQHNVYFIEHRNPEDNSGGEHAIKSHVNKYEVKMVVEMVKYFVRNGYTKPDDIAVLTPYLGQMIKIRDALAKSFVVVIDERDALNIAEIEEQEQIIGTNTTSNIETISVASKKSLNRQVTLRTVDNFQGEEANIIIVSLVRNVSKSGNISKYDSIGFLNSKNRTNVLLSRARKGMYLIGNSELMEMKSKKMWAPVINILNERKQVGFGMPIACNKHPYYKNTIVDPDQFEKISPNGGCCEDCNMSLPCGHKCKYKCHSDDPEHIGVKCNERCLRLLPECYHPCTKLCFDNCGRCEFPIEYILLRCGHILHNVKCWQNRDKDSIKCKVLVSKKLQHCEHYKDIRCFESVNMAKCTELCGKQLECGHKCPDLCSNCQERSKSQKSEDKNTSILASLFFSIEQTPQHGKCQSVCDKLLFCGHTCESNCHERSECPPCVNNCPRKNNSCFIN